MNDMNTKEAKKRIGQLIKELELICAQLGESDPVVPAASLERMEKKRCVKCGELLEARPGLADRFCHNACARLVRRAIEIGELTDNQAVESGLWGPIKKPGRRRKSLNPFVAESAARYAQDDTPPKQVRKAKGAGE